MTDRPAPPVPAECTMAGNDWFPLHFDRLRKSKWWRRATDLARARNVMLWGEAYKQVPGGSMPDDDDELAEAAGFGMNVDAFIAAKAEIMSPWVLCNDGRWYHPTVCEVVLDAWEKASERRKAAAVKKAAQRAKARGQEPALDRVPARATEVPRDSEKVPEDIAETARDIGTHNRRGEDRTEEDRTGDLSDPLGSAPQAALSGSEDLDPLAQLRALPIAKGSWRLAVKVLVEQGRQSDAKARAFIGKLKAGRLTDDELWKIAEAAWTEETEDPVPYLVKAAEGIVARRGQSSPLAPEEWMQRRWMQEFTENPTWWRPERGPTPGELGCRVSPEIRREFGVEPAKPQAVAVRG